ncbi:tumor necrosis factor receptor superfamily member 1A [Rhinatrema bivittatum]|uniref:tumor necrosis factor receptor superfamily member 1A n=1 Tax=Rhinatrema bivittatum TaxID=194408 RepID=UPI0011275D13|nr:tumor necrosis factor receptor superfamily member 1A [Rhinatrema bivittatum]
MVVSALFCLLLVFVNVELLLTAELSGRISLPEAILVHGSPVGYWNISRDSVRKRRNVKCNSDEHPNRKQEFCCKKCQRGFHRSSDCRQPGLMTGCVPCPSRTYADVENYSSKCQRCSECPTGLGQVEKTTCDSTRDTVCGCPEGQYQVPAGITFQCKNCSACENGKPLTKCVGYNDTLCSCFHGFYFTKEDRTCHSCQECQDSDCEVHCPRPPEETRPNPPDGLSPILLSLVAVLATGFILMLLGFVWRYQRKRRKSLYCQVTAVSSDQPTPDQLATEQTRNAYLPGYPIPSQMKSSESGETAFEPAKVSASAQIPKLPDCINDVVIAQLPEKPRVLYAVVDNVPPSRWKEFMRRLGLSDYDIERIEIQNDRRYREAQYEMLLAWRQRTGQTGSTLETISRVLREMDLSGCSENIQESLQRHL